MTDQYHYHQVIFQYFFTESVPLPVPKSTTPPGSSYAAAVKGTSGSEDGE